MINRISSKLTRIQFMFFFLFCASLFADEVRLKNAEISDVTEPQKLGKTTRFLACHVPLRAMTEKDFSLFYKVDIEKYGHYAEVRIGLSHSVYPRRVSIGMSKGDNGIQTASVEASLLPFFSFTHKQFELPKSSKVYLFSIEYNAISRSVRWSLFSRDGEMLEQTPWVKVGEELMFDRFSIWAKRSNKELENDPTSVEVDDDEILVTSWVGSSPSYTLKCMISEIRQEDGISEDFQRGALLQSNKAAKRRRTSSLQRDI